MRAHISSPPTPKDPKIGNKCEHSHHRKLSPIQSLSGLRTARLIPNLILILV